MPMLPLLDVVAVTQANLALSNVIFPNLFCKKKKKMASDMYKKKYIGQKTDDDDANVDMGSGDD